MQKTKETKIVKKVSTVFIMCIFSGVPKMVIPVMEYQDCVNSPAVAGNLGKGWNYTGQ